MAKQVIVKKDVETLFTYLNEKTGAIIAILADGTKWGKSIKTGRWVHVSTKKADVPMEQWIANKRALLETKPKWAQNVKSLPSLRTMERWSSDGIAKTVDGQSIEPDGIAANGCPSWLLVVGVI